MSDPSASARAQHLGPGDESAGGGQGHPPGDIIAELARLALAQAEVDAVELTAFDGADERVLAWVSRAVDEVGPWPVPADRRVHEALYARREPLLVEDLAARGVPPSAGGPWRALAALPLAGDGAVSGILWLLSLEPRGWSADELGRLGGLCGLAGTVLDLQTQVREARKQLVAMDSIVDGYLVVDRSWRIAELSPGLELLLGVSGSQLRGRELWEEYAEAAESAFAVHCRRAASRRGPSEFEVYAPPLRRWVEVFALPTAEHITFYFRDIAERKAEEERTLRSAHRDPLTGLATRAQLVEWLTRALGRANRRPDFAFALLFLDVDRLKIVNDTLGHLVGDEVLRTVARRLEESVRPGDSVARFGGDEFAVLLYNVDGVEDATRITGRIQRALRTPMVVEEREIRTTSSVGIALSTSGYRDGEEMLHHADLALYRAKLLGRERYEVFDDTMRENAAEAQRLKRDLHAAVAAGQLDLELDPVVSLDGGAPAWFDARPVWPHPRRGRLHPRDFLYAAEDSSLILDLGAWVLGRACAALGEGVRASVAVRLSARHFLSPDLLEGIALALANARVSGERLRISLPAPALVEHAGPAIEVARGLGRLGTPLLLHDFGAGLVSLDQLSELPIEAAVIDMRRGAEHARLAATLARALGLRLVAGEVGSVEEVELARGLGAELGSGPALGAAVGSAR